MLKNVRGAVSPRAAAGCQVMFSQRRGEKKSQDNSDPEARDSERKAAVLQAGAGWRVTLPLLLSTCMREAGGAGAGSWG